MLSPGKHRKRVRHYDNPDEVHELTFSCYQRMPLLSRHDWCVELSRSIDAAAQNHRFGLAAFVFMPEHVHLLVYPLDSHARVSALLYAIKRPFSYRIKRCLIREQDSLLERLTIRERPGKTVFRFWQEGSGYDRNLSSPKVIQGAIEYIHLNPVRRGLCGRPEQWKWSSFSCYESGFKGRDPDLPDVSDLELWER